MNGETWMAFRVGNHSRAICVRIFVDFHGIFYTGCKYTGARVCVCVCGCAARNKIEMKYANMKNMRQPENMLRKNCQFTERHTYAHTNTDAEAHPH